MLKINKAFKIVPIGLIFGTVAALLAGCGPKVYDLSPGKLPPDFAQKLPFSKTIGVEEFSSTHKITIEDKTPGGQIANMLVKNKIFEKVIYPYNNENENVDIILKGKIKTNWKSTGFLNFITWFPGPLLFMPNWRGTRFIYELNTEIELIDADSGKTAGQYQTSTLHKLIHRSGNPIGHIFGAALIIPGVVKGSLNIWPRRRYRKMIWDKSYPDLWARAVGQMVNDLEKWQAAREVEMRARCSNRYDHDPVNGDSWQNFVACQNNSFNLASQESTPNGINSVYVRYDGAIYVHVFNDKITKWKFVKKQHK